jgi:hypothetical protein
MRILYYAPVLLGLAALIPLPVYGGGKFKLEAGFTLLFNGKNLDGWQPKGKAKDKLDGKTEAFKGRFKVADGVLVIDPSVKGGAYIETQKQFKDVTIRFDFNAGEKCNNDFFVRGTKFDIVPGKAATATVKEGEWYTLEITASGDKVMHQINGKTVRTEKAKSASAPFIIRAEFGAIQIKNIRVKE